MTLSVTLDRREICSEANGTSRFLEESPSPESECYRSSSLSLSHSWKKNTPCLPHLLWPLTCLWPALFLSWPLTCPYLAWPAIQLTRPSHLFCTCYLYLPVNPAMTPISVLSAITWHTPVTWPRGALSIDRVRLYRTESFTQLKTINVLSLTCSLQ